MKWMIFVFLFLFAGCFNPDDPAVSNAKNIQLQFMKQAGIDVASASCRVSAEDMDTLTADLTVSSTMISGQVPDVPYGDNRLFEIHCYNSDGVLNYYGSTIANINRSAPVINITLYPQEQYADVTIIGNFSTGEGTEEKIVSPADYSGTHNIYIMDTDGTNIRRLTDSDYDDRRPQLSPDRTKVTFYRNTHPDHIAYILDLETRELELLPLTEYTPSCISWHPDGNSLVFHSAYYGYCDVFNYDLQTHTVTTLIRNDTTIWVPVYSPDGNFLLYYTKVNNEFRAYIANADGTDPQLLNPGDTRTNVFPVCLRRYEPGALLGKVLQ
ncbi:MAG: hypothetical protein U5N56_08265 [Candidatus Marinimicrobia bacterium]|nr:hypothetical protein [Candidatus Neomarinimicrobiota bacterium]